MNGKNKEEVLINLQAWQEKQFKLNIVSQLQTELGKGDSHLISARKSIPSIIDDMQKAIGVYSGIPSVADKYIDMAKALGETSIQKSLEDIKKNANSLVKQTETTIGKLKAL